MPSEMRDGRRPKQHAMPPIKLQRLRQEDKSYTRALGSSLNTSPSTFGWTAEKTVIEVHSPGMYVVSAAIFVPGSPTIGVTVNGQIVLRRVPSSRQTVDSTGLIAGSSLRDVVSLMAGSRVAVQVELSNANALHDAHGLLEIKKLW